MTHYRKRTVIAYQVNGRIVSIVGLYYGGQNYEAYFGLERRAVLERLIWWADREVEQSLGEDDAAFNRYLNRVTENRTNADRVPR